MKAFNYYHKALYLGCCSSPRSASDFTRFSINNTFISNVSLKLAKIKQKLSKTLSLNFYYLKIIHFLHPRYHPKIIGDILKNLKKNKYVCFNDVIQLMTMKMRLKMKNRSQRYNINRPRPRHGPKYTKYKMRLSLMIVVCIKQHLSNIWS